MHHIQLFQGASEVDRSREAVYEIRGVSGGVQPMRPPESLKSKILRGFKIGIDDPPEYWRGISHTAEKIHSISLNSTELVNLTTPCAPSKVK